MSEAKFNEENRILENSSLENDTLEKVVVEVLLEGPLADSNHNTVLPSSLNSASSSVEIFETQDNFEMHDNTESDEELLQDAELMPLKMRISGVIFSATRPVTVDKLLKILPTELEVIKSELAQLMQEINSANFGFLLEEVAGGYQFRTRLEIVGDVRRFLNTKPKKLSKAAAETLAIVAYKQPITKVVIESIRGVDATPTIKTLLDEKLIEIVGRENTLGHPTLYGTTDFFLEKFGLNTLLDLPPLRELNNLAAEPDSIEEVFSEDRFGAEAQQI